MILMRNRFLLLLLPAFVAVSGAAAAQEPSRTEAAALEFFEKKVRPLLVENCFTCHSADTNSKGGLRVDDRNGLLNGGGRGPAVVPGHPEKSLLIHAVQQTGKLKMPQGKQLTDAQVAILTKWIKDGAIWPRVDLPASLGAHKAKYERLRKEHWAWQPLSSPKTPAVKDAGWAHDDIDRFLLAKLDEKGLRPTADADALTLIRRVTFDLTGLPPTAAEAEEFAKAWEAAGAKRPEVLEKAVDRLLASSAFGERWGRHWLDIARYGESTGSARNLPMPHAWRYRDYVIDAFNSDMPFDQFVREQIAGDLLPAKFPAERDRQLIATGFLALGVKDVNQRFKVRFIMDNIDEQIDTVTRSVLALTASCARCHDHKFDPIPATDYYALAGIFGSSDLCAGLRNKMGGGGLDYYDPALLLPLGAGAKIDARKQAKIEETKAALGAARAELTVLVDDPKKSKAGPEREEELTAVRKRIKSIQANLIGLTDPAVNGGVAFGVRDAVKVGDTELRIRGEAEKLGPTVPRGFLSIFDVPGAAKVNPQQSGRLELAQWLTSAKNPLTPRVIVNRAWKHLFGQGIVASVDNFGVTGEKPSHPELLDHLATRFINDGWSVKKLVRTLVLTHAYQLSADGVAENQKIDPANRLVWRHSPRRLDAEEIRDAMLAVAGNLDRARPNGSAAMEMKVIELTNVSPEAKRIEKACEGSMQRSIYLPLLRTLTPRALEVFDFAEQGLVTGSRDSTTVPTQALYLLNDPFVRQQAQALALCVHEPKDLDDAARITLAYRLALSRPATAKEIERARVYLAEYQRAARLEGASADLRGAAWASFAQAILASAEFRFIR
jgi:cytochrome c553